MSFYRSFPSKEDLVAEYLREQEREYFEWWDTTIAPFKGDPLKQLYALFDSYLGMTCSAGEAEAECRTSRGCALGNAAVEIPEDNEMLAGIVHDYKSEIRKRFAQTCARCRRARRQLARRRADAADGRRLLHASDVHAENRTRRSHRESRALVDRGALRLTNGDTYNLDGDVSSGRRRYHLKTTRDPVLKSTLLICAAPVREYRIAKTCGRGATSA